MLFSLFYFSRFRTSTPSPCFKKIKKYNLNKTKSMTADEGEPSILLPPQGQAWFPQSEVIALLFIMQKMRRWRSSHTKYQAVKKMPRFGITLHAT
jgi:hypothetical protein